jgi:hypothetical protein
MSYRKLRRNRLDAQRVAVKAANLKSNNKIPPLPDITANYQDKNH